MPKPRLLYLSVNDGSDTRINKEVKTLSAHFDIDYAGIGLNADRSFARQSCRRFVLTTGRHKHPLTFLRHYFSVLRLCLTTRYAAVHVINENLLLLFLPVLWPLRRRVVLDVFDSVFLRSGEKWHRLRDFCYRFPRRLIVTDHNRKTLVPAAFHHKTVVVENYPYRFEQPPVKASPAGALVIFYNGSMSRSRGTGLLRGLLHADPHIRVRMAGWIYDTPTQELAAHPQVDFLGVVPQDEALRIAAGCDYILSVYEPANANNIHASPNKIYDAIQAGTPVIINREVKVSAFVEAEGLGLVTDRFDETDFASLARRLHQARGTFRFDGPLRETYTWQAVAPKLVEAHQA